MKYKHNTFIRICVFVTLFVLIAQPVLADVSFSDENDYLAGKADAEYEAGACGGRAWFLIGLCGGIFGVLVAYLNKPYPSISFITGESQAYINGYIDGYREKCLIIQRDQAMSGCILNTAFVAIIYYVNTLE